MTQVYNEGSVGPKSGGHKNVLGREWGGKKTLFKYVYRGADKSLARPGTKQATFPAFYGTWRFITTFTTAHHLSLP